MDPADQDVMDQLDLAPDAQVDPTVDLQLDRRQDTDMAASCEGECAAVQYTQCTCDPGDPCGWRQDGICDYYYCATVTTEFFDDSDDCGSNAACEGHCGLGQYDACTCDEADPCGWAADGHCDQPSCTIVSPEGYFDDSVDCGGPVGACDGDCGAGRYTECTCGSEDPCGWVGNGTCDDQACEAVAPGAHFDDESDCGIVTGEETFAVTAVRDDLNNRDMELMANGLEDLGMSQTVRDTNVSTSTLTNYLGQELTVLYHTGHGLSGEVMTSNGSVEYDEVTINVHHTIFATCLTLARSWARAFGTTAQTILGYTQVSFDYVDDDVANAFLDELEDGAGYMEAWYLANAGIWYVNDRWAGYVREGGDIVEYSARSHNIPSSTSSKAEGEPTLIQLGRSGRLWVSETVLEDQTTFDSRLVAHVDPDTRPAAGFLPGGWGLLMPNRMSPEQAVEMATTFIRTRLGDLERDAVQDDIIPVIARPQEGQEVTVGHLVRFSRRLDGLPIRGNRMADHITLLVGPLGVAAWSMYWPEYQVVAAPEDWSAGILSIAEATSRAADEISRSVKGELRLLDARPVYGTAGPGARPQELVPAYELSDDTGGRVVVDARSGQPVL